MDCNKKRLRLQKGENCVNLSDEKLREFFATDATVSGGKKNVEVLGIPKGEVAFIFCKIKGRKDGIQTFIDDGCNCCIMRDGIPERELKSCKIRKGRISIDVATSISVHATGEWGCLLPLENGQQQLVRGLTVPKVTADMALMQLKSVLNDIKAGAPQNKDLQKIQIPEVLGGEVDMILGIQFTSVYPEPIHRLDNGLTVFRSKFLPSKPGEIACMLLMPTRVFHSLALDH